MSVIKAKEGGSLSRLLASLDGQLPALVIPHLCTFWSPGEHENPDPSHFFTWLWVSKPLQVPANS